MTVESINMVENDKFGTKQSNKNAAYWHQRNDDDGYINFEKYNDEEILRTHKIVNTSLSVCLGSCYG